MAGRTLDRSCQTCEGKSFIEYDSDDKVDFSNAVLIACSMPSSMSELDASNAYFERCNFRGAEGTMIIDGATFKDCDFTGSHIRGLSYQPGMAHVDIPLSELMGERTEFAVDSYLAEVELPQGADGKTVYDILERARLDHLAEQRDAETTSDVFDTLGLDRSVWEKDVMRSSIFNNGREAKLQKDFENLLGLNKDPEVTVTPVSDVKRFNGVEGDYRVPRDLPKPEDGPIFRPVSIPGPNDGPLRPNPMPRPKDGPIFEPLPKDDGGYVTWNQSDGKDVKIYDKASGKELDLGSMTVGGFAASQGYSVGEFARVWQSGVEAELNSAAQYVNEMARDNAEKLQEAVREIASESFDMPSGLADMVSQTAEARARHAHNIERINEALGFPPEETFKPIDGNYDNDTNDGRDDKPHDDGPSL